MSYVLSLPYPVQALLATLFTWFITALGASLVFFSHKARPIAMDAMLGFGAGVMLASSFWSLLLPCVEMAHALAQPGWLLACSGFLCGGALLLWGDELLAHHTAAHSRTSMLITSITLHNIPEGLAVGVAFGALSAGYHPGLATAAWMLAIGIALQNFPEGAAVSLPLHRDGLSCPRAFFWGQISAIVEPISGLIGALLAVYVRNLLPFMLSFAAGAMVLVVISELVPESQRSSHKVLISLFTLLGFCVMMALDVALG